MKNKAQEITDHGYMVYMERARHEYHAGEYELAEANLDYLLEHLKDVEKRSSVYELKVVINNRLGHYRKALLFLRDGLHELGVDIPLEEDARGQGGKDLHVNGNTSDQCAGGKIEHQKDILKLLIVGGMSLHHTSDRLMTWGALQVIRWSEQGLDTGEKAIGYVVYGRIKTISGFFDEGFAYGTKAVQVNNDLGDIALRCRVYGIFGFFILPWKKPFSESEKYFREACDAGERAGDFIGCYVIKTHQLNFRILSGVPLREIDAITFEESNPQKELTYYITHYQKNLVRFLTGKTTVFSIPRLQPSWQAATNTIQEEKFYRNYVWSRYYFLFGYYELSEQAAREANNNRKLQEGSPLIPANDFLWFLSVTQSWINYDSGQREKFIPLLEDILSQMKSWFTHSPANYEACYWLLKAEYGRINNDPEISAMYEQSLRTAGDNLWYKAIICECHAKQLLTEHRQRESGRKMLLESIAYYEQWGALAKVWQIRQQYDSILSSGNAPSASINIEMIQHELSGDLEVESLVKKLMILCLRISGSTSVIMESVDENRILRRLGKFSLLQQHNKSQSGGDRFAAKVLQSFLQDPSRDHEFTGTDYNEETTDHARSFLVLPVSIRDHLSFMLYLENIFSEGVYTAEIIKWIKITVNQGAVIIENARIHEVTLKLNEEIRVKMEEKERLVREIQKQKDLHLQALDQTQNNERRRIASDLHDSLGAILSGVRLRFNSLQEDFANAIPEKAPRFRDTLALLDDAVQELRRIAHNMLPVSLHRFGLEATLHTFVDQINEAGQLEVELQVLGLKKRLSEEYEMALYRICQELVQNVIKHSEATTVRIQIIQHGDIINLIVEDNGKGIDMNEIREGLGLMTIQSKVGMLHGNFAIEAQPGKGTMVLIDLPVPGATRT